MHSLHQMIVAHLITSLHTSKQRERSGIALRFDFFQIHCSDFGNLSRYTADATTYI